MDNLMWYAVRDDSGCKFVAKEIALKDVKLDIFLSGPYFEASEAQAWVNQHPYRPKTTGKVIVAQNLLEVMLHDDDS